MTSVIQHPWNVTPKEAEDIQRRLATQVRETSLGFVPQTVAGADVSIEGEVARAALVVLRYEDMQPLEQVTVEQPVTFPYIPGLLSFRETPALLEAFQMLQQQPDLVICDAQGRAHPRRLGLASHVGLLLDLPVIGCAKSRLVGLYEEPGQQPGDWSPLFNGEERIGAVVRTRQDTAPVFVSIGHRITLEEAIHITLACCRGYRLPEPTRLAHLAAGGKQVVPPAQQLRWF